MIAASVMKELNYIVEFQTAIRGHHIHKGIWEPSIGQSLVCKIDAREKTIEYDKNDIDVFKSGDEETLARHVPI